MQAHSLLIWGASELRCRRMLSALSETWNLKLFVAVNDDMLSSLKKCFMLKISWLWHQAMVEFYLWYWRFRVQRPGDEAVQSLVISCSARCTSHGKSSSTGKTWGASWLVRDVQLSAGFLWSISIYYWGQWKRSGSPSGTADFSAAWHYLKLGRLWPERWNLRRPQVFLRWFTNGSLQNFGNEALESQRAVKQRKLESEQNIESAKLAKHVMSLL